MNKTRTSMTEPQSSTLSPPLDDVLILYFHRLESAMNCTGDIIAVGKNLVCNLKLDNNSDETIFHELSSSHSMDAHLHYTQQKTGTL
jgi:hypothetical protein